MPGMYNMMTSQLSIHIIPYEVNIDFYLCMSTDESFAVCHSAPGVLGMANHGRNTNNSQFYITLSPASWMDRQYVAFG